MAPSQTLRIDKRKLPGGTLVHIAGELDASFQRADLRDLAGLVVFDLDGVRRITSFGVREWVSAMGALDVEHACIIHARPAIVAQLNMVGGFAGGAALVSFYLPYVCEACDVETDLLVDLRTPPGKSVLQPSAPLPVARCHRCGAEAELDDVPEAYLSFARTQGSPPLPSALNALVDVALGAATSPRPAPFRAQKEVTGLVTSLWLQGCVSSKARLRRLADGFEGIVLVVLAGVTSVDDAGSSRLLDVAESADADVYWARVPLSLLDTGNAPLQAALAGRVATVLLSSSCASCAKLVTLELDAIAMKALLARSSTDRSPVHAGEPRANCPACGAPWPVDSAAGATEVLDLFAERVPSAVMSYLAAHPGEALPDVGAVRVPASAPPSTGTLSGSALTRYEAVRPLGRGGMAEVSVAKQRGPEGFVKQVALKRILPELAANEHFSQLFLQEARVAAAITHPNVVQIFDLGQDDDGYFIAMELVDGWDLRSVISAAQHLDVALPVELACRIASDICAGLHAAHSCADDDGRVLELVHRDVSPHNVLLSLNGAVKLTDFGVSKVAHSLLETRAGNLKGKVIYMAPEQIDPARGDVDRRTDLWAVGVVLWEMLTGTPLFRRDSEYMSMFAVLNEPVPSVRSVRPDVPGALDDIIARCVSREPDARFSSARALQLELEATLVAIARVATAAHLSQWLEALAARSHESGAMDLPLLTPTHSTISIDGGITLHGALRQTAEAAAPAKAPKRKKPPRG